MLNQILIPEFQHEIASTKRMLARVPSGQFSFQPHSKSNSLGRLAVHVANIPTWMTVILTTDGFDYGKDRFTEEPANSTDALLDVFGACAQTALQALQTAFDEALQGKWVFGSGEHVIFSQPRIGAIRTLALSHLIHHRGQLSVYLRLLNVPVPGMYGPSADEV